MRPTGVRDSAWSPGFARLATKTGSPVLPVHIAAQNSPLFYGASMLARPLASLLLAREMFGAAKARIGFNVGELVPSRALTDGDLAPARAAVHMRRHVYRLARRRPTVFPTSSAIAHPESPLAVRSALRRAERFTRVVLQALAELANEARGLLLRERDAGARGDAREQRVEGRRHFASPRANFTSTPATSSPCTTRSTTPFAMAAPGMPNTTAES